MSSSVLEEEYPRMKIVDKFGKSPDIIVDVRSLKKDVRREEGDIKVRLVLGPFGDER